MMRFSWFMLSLKCASAMGLMSAIPVHAQRDTAASYGKGIAEDQIEQRAKLDVLMGRKRPERDDVINEMINERSKINEASKLGYELTSAQIDFAFAEMCARMHVTPQQLTRSLEERGVQVETLKNYIQAEIARTSLAGPHYRKSQDPSDKYRDPYFKHQDPPLLRQ